MQLVRHNHFFALLITCHVLIALIFIKIGLKLSYSCQKNKKFSSAEGSAPTPHASGGWGPCPQTPATPPSPHCRFLATGLNEEKFTACYCRPPLIQAFGFKYNWNVWRRRCSHSQTVYNTAKSISPDNADTEKLSQKFFSPAPTPLWLRPP